MFARLIVRSILQRKRHIALALVAVVVGTALVAALFSVYSDVRLKMSRELRRYGANMVVLPPSGSLPIEPDEASRLREDHLGRISGVLSDRTVIGWTPLRYQVVTANGAQQVVLVGLRFESALKVHPYWEITGRLPGSEDDDGLVAGVDAAAKLGLKIGDLVTLTNEAAAVQKKMTFRVTALVRSGASEDQQLFADLDAIEPLTGSKSADLVAVSVLGGVRSIEQLQVQIQRVAPSVRVEPVLKISRSEGQLLHRVILFTLVATVIILTVVTMAAVTTIQSLVRERRQEVGLMKALGGTNRHILGLYLCESGLVGLLGGLTGYALGALSAQGIGRSVFGAGIDLHPEGFFVVIVTGLLISVLGVLFSLREVVDIEPAITLRGE